VITCDFQFIFLNELNIVIKPPHDMKIIRLVTQAHFYDEKDMLITGGIKGVFIFKFDY
jgi:WD40 repeat protein